MAQAPDPTRDLLDTAIQNLCAQGFGGATLEASQLQRVRNILQELCSESEEGFQIACERLLITQDQDPGDSNEDKQSVPALAPASEHDSPSQLQTKLEKLYTGVRYDKCIQCDHEYNVLDNPEDCCVWHEKRLVIDDVDPIWKNGSFHPYPHAYRWACCRVPAEAKDHEGCKKGVHVSRFGKDRVGIKFRDTLPPREGPILPFY